MMSSFALLSVALFIGHSSTVCHWFFVKKTSSFLLFCKLIFLSMDIYKYRSYRKLIQQWINSSEKNGARTQLARAASCSPSWITRVLNGTVHFTPDQAFASARFFGFGEDETEYFLQLVELERSGTSALKAHI
ncbi:MAG: helix-turn-helix domain-containing protein [Bdellovibrionales bacterium]|nr:helix-turn-helix domain-containing protein [Bdellovibrionales bacterium]